MMEMKMLKRSRLRTKTMKECKYIKRKRMGRRRASFQSWPRRIRGRGQGRLQQPKRNQRQGTAQRPTHFSRRWLRLLPRSPNNPRSQRSESPMLQPPPTSSLFPHNVSNQPAPTLFFCVLSQPFLLDEIF